MQMFSSHSATLTSNPAKIDFNPPLIDIKLKYHSCKKMWPKYKIYFCCYPSWNVGEIKNLIVPNRKIEKIKCSTQVVILINHLIWDKILWIFYFMDSFNNKCHSDDKNNGLKHYT